MPTTLNPATSTEEARAAAVANAKSKAASYAKLLGTSIGKVLSLEEQSSPVYSSPFPMAKAEAADSAVQIDLGEQDVTVTITVRFGPALGAAASSGLAKPTDPIKTVTAIAAPIFFQ
jgi:uncharacterized protein YggE